MASDGLGVASWPAGGWWLHHGQRGAGGCIMTCLALMILVLVVSGRTLASAVTCRLSPDTTATAGLQLRAEICHGTMK